MDYIGDHIMIVAKALGVKNADKLRKNKTSPIKKELTTAEALGLLGSTGTVFRGGR